MSFRTRAIARYTVIEALRTRLVQATALVVLLILGASYFVHEIALIESARLQTALYAACSRIAAVFIVSLHVVASLARETEDKGIDAVLALDVPRWQYLLAKFAGHAVLAVIVAIVCSLPLFAFADGVRAASWLASLVLELWIIAALAAFCVMTFSHVPSAMTFVAAFYVLCRALAGLRLIAQYPIASVDTPLHNFLAGGLDLIGLLLPAFDAWTRTDWLLDAPPEPMRLAVLAGETALYVALLLCAALIDLYRKEL